MTEQEFHRALSDLLWNPPKRTYVSTSGGTYVDTDYFKREDLLLSLIKEAGYKRRA